MITILLDNAVKYSTEGSPIRISGSIHKDEAVFTVKDYGIGIPEKDLPYVMDRFIELKRHVVGSKEGQV